MSDVVSNDELNALAAEYVLGTLDHTERRGAAALLEVDATFRGIVRVWERRFGELHLMVEAVEPDPQLWLRIKSKMPAVEQIAPAIPSHMDDIPPAVVAPLEESPAPPAAESPPTAPAVAEPAVAGGSSSPATGVSPSGATPTEPKLPESKSPETNLAETNPPEPRPTEQAPTETKPVEPAELRSAEAPSAEAKPAEANPADAKPAETTPPAIAEADRTLAEFAALLPTSGDQSASTEPTVTPVPEDGLHTHAPDVVPRGFVPPPPMMTRGAPTVVEVPVVKKGGRGWMAATLVMALVAVALVGLIGAWRFFPERLPAQLRANAVLGLTTSAAEPTAQTKAARPKLPAFDE